MSQLSFFENSAPKDPHWSDMPFLVVDTETTGLNHQQNRVIEIAWVLFDKQLEVASDARLCAIEGPLPAEITTLTGIHSDMLVGQPAFSDHMADFLEACSKASYLVAYNANFDRSFIESEFGRAGHTFPEVHWVDPCIHIREIDRYKKGKRLSDAAARWGVQMDGAHRALADAKAAGHLFLKLAPHLKAASLKELLILENGWRSEQERQYRAYKARNPS
ncbi:MAG: 3'-5' exonuclease [Myxococcota bacterium]